MWTRALEWPRRPLSRVTSAFHRFHPLHTQAKDSGPSLSDTFEYYGRQHHPVISSSASDPIQKPLRSQDWTGKLDKLARVVTKTQLQTYAQSKKDVILRFARADSLTDLAALKAIASFSLVDEGNTAAIKALHSIPPALLRRTLWNAARLTYTALLSAQRALKFSPDDPSCVEDTEDLRTLDLDEWILHNEKDLRDETRSDWRRGLVAYSKHAGIVFPDSTLESSSRTLTRFPVSGYTFLDELKAETLRIQASIEEFRKAFSSVTGGVLNGLDWSNVFVAGGAALSSLCCVDASDVDKYKTSDIDIYIYGLDPIAANKKIEEIFQVWKKNLPEDAKEEIVLKLISNPKEVLLNFDLDQCAIGWDGSEVWLLPRAARALETGYTVFTMNLIKCHYLGERRATQEQRVFKYADKGSGIRILPSYLHKLDEKVTSLADGSSPSGVAWGPELYGIRPLDLIATKASIWIRKVIREFREYPNIESTFTHAMLKERTAKTSEPADRPCLQRFEVLLRHVALWQEKVKGNIMIDDKAWATTEYDMPTGVPISYDDVPAYEWNEEFTIGEIQSELENFNITQYEAFAYNLYCAETELEAHLGFSSRINSMGTDIQRLCLNSSVSPVLSTDAVLCVFVPPSFLTYANALVMDALIQHGLEAQPVLEEIFPSTSHEYARILACAHVIPARWRISSNLTWQLLDRRIDEDYNSASSFVHRAVARSIRRAPNDEFASFVLWASRKPIEFDYSYAVGQGFWDKINGPDDQEEELSDGT